MGSHWLVFAACYLYTCRPKISSIDGEPIESYPAQMKKVGRAQLKRALWIKIISDHLAYGIELV